MNESNESIRTAPVVLPVLTPIADIDAWGSENHVTHHRGAHRSHWTLQALSTMRFIQRFCLFLILALFAIAQDEPAYDDSIENEEEAIVSEEHPQNTEPVEYASLRTLVFFTATPSLFTPLCSFHRLPRNVLTRKPQSQ
jgi:hypothetical protein